MEYFDVDLVAEVRRNRELLLEKYGGVDGLHKHMDEERPKLEAQGWKFIDAEEIVARKHRRASNGETANL